MVRIAEGVSALCPMKYGAESEGTFIGRLWHPDFDRSALVVSCANVPVSSPSRIACSSAIPQNTPSRLSLNTRILICGIS